MSLFGTLQMAGNALQANITAFAGAIAARHGLLRVDVYDTRAQTLGHVAERLGGVAQASGGFAGDFNLGLLPAERRQPVIFGFASGAGSPRSTTSTRRARPTSATRA